MFIRFVFEVNFISIITGYMRKYVVVIFILLLTLSIVFEVLTLRRLNIIQYLLILFMSLIVAMLLWRGVRSDHREKLKDDIVYLNLMLFYINLLNLLLFFFDYFIKISHLIP